MKLALNRKVLSCFLSVAAILSLTGCITQKPLPFVYSPAKNPSPDAPALQLTPLRDGRRTKDGMDKVLDLPKALDAVLEQELRNSGLFSKVEVDQTAAGTRDIKLTGLVNKLQWEVPSHGRKVATAAAISFATGGIGGVIYGSTDTEVFGHAQFHFTVTSSTNSILLDRDYTATAEEKKAKLNCDTPATFREVAAKAFRLIVDQLTADLQKISAAQTNVGEAIKPQAAVR
jgi:hypothetical protein